MATIECTPGGTVALADIITALNNKEDSIPEGAGEIGKGLR